MGMQYKMGFWTILRQFLYVLDVALIKSSIICTMLDLATKRKYKIVLWGLLALIWISWQVSWPVAVFQCKPVAAAWGQPGDCISGQKVIFKVSLFMSVVNIFTDLATALTPIMLLRHVQLAPRIKILTMIILSLGLLASVTTTVRIAYAWAFVTPNDRFYETGKIILATVLECDLGIIAGSSPMLRPLFPGYLSSNPSRFKKSSRLAGGGLVTIGGERRAHYKLIGTLDSIEIVPRGVHCQDINDGPSRHDYEI